MHRANRDEDSLEIYLSLLVWKVAAMGLALSIIRTPDRTEVLCGNCYREVTAAEVNGSMVKVLEVRSIA